MEIDRNTVALLIRQQFPHLDDLPIEPVSKQGWDNATFRLGDALSVRLPRNESYAEAVKKEARALTVLSEHLSVEVPSVVAVGLPSDTFPLPWSIRRWIEGDTLESTDCVYPETIAVSLGKTLCDLRAIDTGGGFIAGKHSFYRGCHPSAYGDEVQKSLDILGSKVDAMRCLEVWQRGMTSAWTARPVWFHGDVAIGNIIVTKSVVKALIDFGTCGIGDPACDFVMAWTYFDPESRNLFRDACEVDDQTWQRARAWALWKALVCMSGLSSPDTDGTQAKVLQAICNDVD